MGLRAGMSRGRHPGQLLLSPKHSASTVSPESAHTETVKETLSHLLTRYNRLVKKKKERLSSSLYPGRVAESKPLIRVQQTITTARLAAALALP